MDPEAIDKLVQAGRIAAEAREYAARLLAPGVSAREVCERVESFIVERGGRPAFPCNFSVNHVAAHYTPGVRDDVVLEGSEVVKIDVGVHVDGYIADTAVTVDLSGKYGKLLEAARSALEAAMRVVRPNVRVYDIGKAVEAAVRRHGFRVVRNLTGHTIDRWIIHAGTSIPNYPDRTGLVQRLRPGTLVAIEPFATDGRGIVRDGGTVNIFSLMRRKKASLTSEEQAILDFVEREYRTLPFTQRWLAKAFPEIDVDAVVKRLAAKGVLHGYPILVEAGRGMVAQFEHTFLILKDRVVITTCPECS